MTQEPSVQDTQELAGDDIDVCPVCLAPFKAGDMCAMDIELGTCHAECLEGSPTVDLDTGEPVDGPIPTYPYVALGDAVASCTDHSGGTVTTSPGGREAEESPSPLPPATSSAMEALREAIEFAEQDYHALTPAGEEMVDRWRAADHIEAISSENERLKAALTEVMQWIDNWDPNFVEDDEWSETAAKVRAALKGEQ